MTEQETTDALYRTLGIYEHILGGLIAQWGGRGIILHENMRNIPLNDLGVRFKIEKWGERVVLKERGEA